MTSERTQDWVDGVVRRLIRCAAKRTPDLLADRLEEEWLADLAEQPGRLARLRFGIGCCWATNVIAREHVAEAPLAAAVSPATHRYFPRFTQDDSPLFTGRTITFVLVVSLHLAVLYGLAMGLGPTFTKIIAGPFEAHFLDPPPRNNLLPPPRPNLLPTRIEAPPPEAMPPIEADPTDVIQEAPREPLRPDLPAQVRTVVTRVAGGPGMGFPSTNDFYPDASIRLGEKGAATVKACVDGKGQLFSEPTIIQSAGSTRLDEAALRLARAGSGHYRATTENGLPVDACYPFRIRFELRN
jgi:TonB family protein